MLLCDAPLGATVVVASIAESTLAVRLHELGIRPGHHVTVMHRCGSDAVVVGVGDQRIALARDIAATVATAGAITP
jgi:Fe2+ transport system protein FeoA